MTSPTPPPHQGSNALGWIGLLLGLSIIGFMVWDNFSGALPGSTTGGNVIELTSDNWQKEVVESKMPVFVDFTASWCGPCRKLAPTIEKLASDYAGRVKFGKVDVDAQNALRVKYRVEAFPQMFIFKGGEVAVNPIMGWQTEDALTRVINLVLQTN